MDEQKPFSYYKQLSLQSDLIMGLVMACTSPVVYIYCIQQISTDFYKVIMFLDELFVLFIFFVLDKRDENDNPKILKKLKIYFVPIITIGCIGFISANLLSLFDVRIRFLILCTIEGIFSYLWRIAMMDLWNNLISGTDLTAWRNKCGKYDRIGAIVGATIILFIDLHIELALAAQCAAYLYMGYCDYRIYKGMKNQAYNHES